MSVTAQGAAIATLASIVYVFVAVPTVTAIVAHDVTFDAPRQALEAPEPPVSSTVEGTGAGQGRLQFLAEHTLVLVPRLDTIGGRDARTTLVAQQRCETSLTTTLRRGASRRSDHRGPATQHVATRAASTAFAEARAVEFDGKGDRRHDER